jgi:diaminopimelate decarboxylase
VRRGIMSMRARDDHRDEPFVDGVALRGLLAGHPTPLIVYSAQRLRENAAELGSAFWPGTRLMFSYKACYLPGVLGVLHASGIDGEVCSGHEYLLARTAGLAADRIVWNAVSLSDGELATAVSDPPRWLGLNTLTDLRRVNDAAGAAGRRLAVALRIHPARISSSYLHRGERLGFDVTDGSALRAVRAALDLPHLDLAGFHSHTQVQQVSPDLLAESLRSSVQFAEEVRAATGHAVRVVSIGGGLAGPHAMTSAGSAPKTFADAFRAVLETTDLPIELALEPGRYLVDDAAIGITRILSRTRAAGNDWLIVDLGTQFLVPFEGREFPVIAAWPCESPTRTVLIGDRLSSYAGVITRSAQLPENPPDDTLIVLDVGAYTASTVQRFMYGMPEIVLVDGQRVAVQWYEESAPQWVERIMSAGQR